MSCGTYFPSDFCNKKGDKNTFFVVLEAGGLHHYERKWGTTTNDMVGKEAMLLYHYEKKWGTGNYDNVSAPNIP